MCGIAGRVGLEQPVAARTPLRTIIDTLRHRGPDDHGLWRSDDGRVELAHRRLSIVDLSPLGRNPMAWDGGRLTITFNGEIYNFLELRKTLEGLGHRFRSHTDTEVILAAYDQWGLDCVQRFVGMFAFALWDAPRQRLWLVRDRLGKKPLYYSERNGTLTFASELKGLLADPDMPRTVDREALGLYLAFGYVPAPLTIFAAARKVPPAHYMLVEGGRTTLVRYWDPLDAATGDPSLTAEAATQELERLLQTAVAERRVADVPLGAFLSGGIDSSLVVALMAEQSRSPVQTYTIRFAEAEFDEADHAAAVARHLRTDHHELLCDERQMLDVVDRLPAMFDEPFADSSAIPTYLVSTAARAGVTVALSGDGGDELFFGYPRYRYYTRAQWALRLPRPLKRVGAVLARRAPTRRLRRISDVLGAETRDGYLPFVEWFGDDAVTAMLGHPAPAAPQYAAMLARIADRVPDTRPGLLDLVSYLPDDILVKVDRASMATSLEVRAPLLDHRVVEFALRLPSTLRGPKLPSKYLLRRLLYARVPQALVDRPKMGFGVPLRSWFKGPLRDRMDACCNGDAFARVGIDPEPLRRTWAEFKGGVEHRPDLLWSAYCLAAWSDSCL